MNVIYCYTLSKFKFVILTYLCRRSSPPLDGPCGGSYLLSATIAISSGQSASLLRSLKHDGLLLDKAQIDDYQVCKVTNELWFLVFKHVSP